MVKIRQNLVKSSIANKMTFNGTNPCDYIVVHQTANTSKGANAEMHGRLQANGNSRQASWHYQVDDKEAVQSFKDTAQCWHAGNANYNKKSIGVEICVNSDGNYKKAVANAIELVKHLMTKHNIPAKNVIRHHDASGKHCPREIMNGKEGITWNNFKAQLSGKGDVEPSTPTPSKPSTSKPATPSKPSSGSIVDYLNSQGKDSSFSARKKLANQYGIKNYKGTAKQNIDLLNKLKSGNPAKQPRPKKSINQMAQEVIAGKHGTGHANRRKSLGISQSEYDKVRAEVNRLAGVKTGLTVEQMANKIINDKNAPTGHEARRKWLGINNATYQKVRARVNQKLR